MKLSTLLATTVIIAISSSALTMADDARYQGGIGPSRGLFGIPLPQQWTGTRPASYTYGPARSNCLNGQCRTTTCPNGDCSSGQCSTGNCSGIVCRNGQCGTAACPNGRCEVGYGTRRGSACPNGRCGLNETGGQPQRDPGSGSPSAWAPRDTRRPADPFRRSDSQDQKNLWTQRSLRPVLDPVNETFRSRYSREELDLNSDYFRGNEGFESNTDRGRPSSRDWNSPSDRSIERPDPASRRVRI